MREIRCGLDCAQAARSFSTRRLIVHYGLLMRVIRLGMGIITAAVIGLLYLLLWEMPLDLAKDIFLHPIAEDLSQRWGLRMPTVETIISSASIAVPFLAAIRTLYLYRAMYLATDNRQNLALIREHRDDTTFEKILQATKTIVSLLVVGGFVIAVLVAGYKEKFGPKIPSPSEYAELHRLPPLELRDRAFAVADKLNRLDRQYDAERGKLQKQYDAAKEKYDHDKADFEQKQSAYETAVRSCPVLNGFGALSGNLGQPSCTVPPIPDRPQEPQFPVVAVDMEWMNSSGSAEVEAAAIWEELLHRQGKYTRFFLIPKNYNNQDSHIAYYAKQLTDEANKLR